MRAPLLPLVGLVLLAATPLPTAAASFPPCDVAWLGIVAVQAGVLVVDQEALNVFGPWTGGTYPGRSVVQAVSPPVFPNGTAWLVVHDACAPLDETWDENTRAVYPVIDAAHGAVVNATRDAAAVANCAWNTVWQGTCG